MTTYIDPLSDFGFKRLFGTEPNKDLLIAFLNSVFEGRKHIVELTYNKNEHPGNTSEEGTAIFDLTCTGADGERFIIEVQRGRPGNFKQRVVFYTSRLISEQAPKGDRSKWGYALKEVYLIALLEEYSIDDETYLRNVCLTDRNSGQVFYEGLGYIFIELINFTKQAAEVKTDLDRWLYVLKNMSRMDKMSVYTRKPIFEKLFNLAEYANLTKEEKDMYDVSQKRRWDNYAVKEYAKEEAKKEVRKELEEEFKKVRKEAAEKVRKETAEKVRKETAEKVRKETAEKVRKETAEKISTEKNYTTVANLIQQLKLDDQTIANIAEVQIDFVRKVRTALEKKKSE